MKKIIVCLFVFYKTLAFAAGPTDYSFPFFFDYYGVSIKLTNDVMEIKNEVYSNTLEKYHIKWSTEDKIDYISFNYNGKNLGNNIKHGEKKYLVLFALLPPGELEEYSHQGYFLAFYEKNKLVFHFIYGQYKWTDDNLKIKASSEKAEKNIVYKAENLLDYSILLPWSEGANGNGTGETVALYGEYVNCILVISNGYVDYDRPYLYGYNNRVKKIKIYDIANENDYKIIDIEDKPGFQIFTLEDFFPDKYSSRYANLVFKIIEVYPGTRYNDTCINYLQFHHGM